MMSDKLSHAQSVFPELRQCTLDQLQSIITQLRVHVPESSTNDNDSSMDSEGAQTPTAQWPDDNQPGPYQLPWLANCHLLSLPTVLLPPLDTTMVRCRVSSSRRVSDRMSHQSPHAGRPTAADAPLSHSPLRSSPGPPAHDSACERRPAPARRTRSARCCHCRRPRPPPCQGILASTPAAGAHGR